MMDAKTADWAAQHLGEQLDKLKPSTDQDYAKAFLGAAWLMGNTPAITSDEQYDVYAKQAAEIYGRTGGPPKNDAEIKQSLMTPDGALAAALWARMWEWRPLR
jgi:hypothetical protein